MKVDLAIKNGNIVDIGGTMTGGVAVDKGKIVAIAENNLLPEAERTIDARGLYLIPGIVDPHLHFGILNPLEKDIRTETTAAISGGVTTIGFFAIAQEGILKAFPYLKDIFEKEGMADVFLHPLILHRQAIEEIPKCLDLGITSFKFLMGYKGSQADMLKMEPLDDGDLIEGMETLAGLGPQTVAIVHAENIDIALRRGEKLKAKGRQDFRAWDDSRPNFCEAEYMMRTIYFSKITGCPTYFVHTTIGEGVEIVAKAKAEGTKVIAETCPQYLTHNNEDKGIFLKHPTFAVVNPPIRHREDNQKLWKGIQDGVIECIGSDHAPYTLEQKGNDMWKAPMGLGNCTEMVLPVMLSEGVNKGRINLEKVVQICCYNPAKVFGLLPKKGRIAIGADADLVLVDMEKKVKVTPEILHSFNDWTIYQDWEFKGWPVMTILRGKIVMEDGKIIDEPGIGRYIFRPCGK